MRIICIYQSTYLNSIKISTEYPSHCLLLIATSLHFTTPSGSLLCQLLYHIGRTEGIQQQSIRFQITDIQQGYPSDIVQKWPAKRKLALAGNATSRIGTACQRPQRETVIAMSQCFCSHGLPLLRLTSGETKVDLQQPGCNLLPRWYINQHKGPWRNQPKGCCGNKQKCCWENKHKDCWGNKPKGC